MSLRAELRVAITLLDTACDKHERDFNITSDELQLIRERRATAMLSAAQAVHRDIVKDRVR